MSVMPQIKHIIYYMLENRSFDNVLGWLFEGNDRPAHVIAGPRTVDLPFQGLAGGDHYNSFDDEPGARHYVVRGVEKDNIPAFDPHEPFEHVNVQLFGREWANKDVPHGTPPAMSGFLQDYSSALKGPLAALADAGGQVGGLARAHSKQISREEALQILQTHSPKDLPVMNGLARAFGVSDLWFASVPTQTFANRAFSVCGTSLGLVDNATSLFGYVPHKFNTKSIWNILSDNGFNQPTDWMVYHQTKQLGAFCLTQCAFDIPEPERHLTHAQALMDAIDSDTLPRFSYLEPSWLRHDVISNGNSYHPPGENAPGESYLKDLYDRLTANPAVWEKTLLIVSFDEHGGTYDHVPPPWGATPPWGNGEPGHVLEHGFKFDRFGVRVPTLFVSPYIERGTVIRSSTDVPFDHTSMIATVLTWMGVPRSAWVPLGQRVANAPTFEKVINRQTPRTDIPDIRLSPVHQEWLDNPPPASKTPITPLQLKVLPLLLQHIHGGTLTPETLDAALRRVLEGADTVDVLITRIEAEATRAQAASAGLGTGASHPASGGLAGPKSQRER